MLHPRSLLPQIALAGLFLLCPTNSGAQLPARRSGPERFVVDSVTLKSNEQLRGAVLGRDADGQLQIAVQREWLKRAQPKLFESATNYEPERLRDAAGVLLKRITVWIEEQPEPGPLRGFLELERERADAKLKSLSVVPPVAKSSQFLLLSFPDVRIKSVITQPPQNRAIALLAWREQLADVERKEMAELQKELLALKIELADPANLADRLPQQPQSELEWAARRAIVEFQYGNRLEYQGFGDSFFETGNAAKPVDWTQFLPQLLEKQLTAQLGDLLGEAKPQRPKPGSDVAIKLLTDSATAKGSRALRWTRLNLDLAAGRATVTSTFLARMPNDQWRVIWQTSVTEDASQERAELERRIGADPQIKELKESIGALGLGIEKELTRAIRTGAATMAAQQAADRGFNTFRDGYVRHLDGPPLVVAPAQQP